MKIFILNLFFFVCVCKVVKLPIYLCCDRIKYLLACSVKLLEGGAVLGKPVQSLVYLGRSTVPDHHKDCQIRSSEQQV